jgi:3-dehydroquinate synthase
MVCVGVTGAGAHETIVVRAGGARSTIVIGAGAIAGLGREIGDRLPDIRRVFVISDERVWAAHGERLHAIFAAAGVAPLVHVIPEGEGSKSLARAGELYGWLAAERAERREPVVAFGGGVVGDLAGFVAATYLRGVPLIQVPTSLLAMVDSSVGGKTGINLPAGKNLVGAFLQPELVIVDPDFLRTLAPRQQRAGWAEVVKYVGFERSVPGVIGPLLLPLLTEQGEALRSFAEPLCTTVIARCLRIKAATVEQDERETGLRRVLNLGHTVGHAIEATAGYGRYTHGEAVALGLRAVTLLAERRELCPATWSRQLLGLVDAFGLPDRIEGCPRADLLARIGSDKKVRAGRPNWILPVAPGEVIISDDVPLDEVAAILGELGAS